MDSVQTVEKSQWISLQSKFGGGLSFWLKQFFFQIETCISRSLQETFHGDNPEKVRYNANSIRNFWKRLWIVIKTKVSDGITEAHFAQTAHIEKTAREKYLHRNGTEEERAHELQVYSDRLANRREDEGSLSEKSSQAHLMHSWTRIWKMSCPSFQYSGPVSTKLRPAADLFWHGTLYSELPYINHTRPFQQLPHAKQTALVPHSQQKHRAPPKRDSWNSHRESPVGTAVTKFHTSMTIFRIRKGLPEWSEGSTEACLLDVQKRTKYCLWVGDKEEMWGGRNTVERRRIPENLNLKNQACRCCNQETE